jgi:phosphonate transport system substrate-binding protein
MAEWYKSVEKAAPHVGLVIRGAPLLVAALLLVVLPMTGRALAQQVPLVFGVLNQQSVVLTAERWNPILNYVSSVSGVPLRLKLGRTVQETDEMMGRGEFDFIYTNHNFQTEYDTLGYRVIARWGGEPIRCVIAVPLDSLVQGLAELRGKRVAFPSPDAFVGNRCQQSRSRRPA